MIDRAPRLTRARPAETPRPEPWSAEETALLARAREQRAQQALPPAVRERLLARAIEDARRGRREALVPPRQLVPIAPRTLTRALSTSAAMALAIVLLANSRRLLDGASEPGARDSAPGTTSAASDRGRGAGAGLAGYGARHERLLATSLFHAPAQLLELADVPAPSQSLLAEAPFSGASRAWQVRRWDDLGADPVHPAAHELQGAALCVQLGAGERVLGGWPWPAPGTQPPPDLALVGGRRYRLVFRAWAREPLPSQLLVAVGHAAPPFSAAAGARVPVSDTPSWFGIDFVPAHGDPAAGIAFLATAPTGDPTRVCVSDLRLIAP